ncbi:MAG: hypothetical protein IH944_06220 [Armatimonadetes bacterium]|nr:hypothetical protein [Armatimonadota bacterium]
MFAALICGLALSGAIQYSAGQVDITPDTPLALGGYTARNDAVFEPSDQRLFARILVLRQGTTVIAIVSAEMLTIPESLYLAVQQQLPKDVELMLVATHTHSAPDSQMLNSRMTFRVPGIASYKEKWLKWYASRIAEGVNGVLDGPYRSDPISVLVADVDANRARREGAVPDKAATWLMADGRPLLTVFSAHATVLDESFLKLSGDWPGALSEASGGLVLPGAIGDVSPAQLAESGVENLERLVGNFQEARIKAQVVHVMSGTSKLAVSRVPIELDSSTPHPDFAEEFGAPSPLDQVLVSRFAPEEAEVVAVSIGGLLLVGIPGEPTSSLGRKVQVFAQSLGFPHCVVVSHVNGWIGYVLEPEDYDRGGYEATMSFHGRETGLRVLESAKACVTALTRVAAPATFGKRG